MEKLFNIEPQHLHEARKMADAIYNQCPRFQQEMIEGIKARLIELNTGHLDKLRK